MKVEKIIKASSIGLTLVGFLFLLAIITKKVFKDSFWAALWKNPVLDNYAQRAFTLLFLAFIVLLIGEIYEYRKKRK